MCLGVLLALLLSGCAKRPSQLPPETIFVGQFITLDSSHSRVEALAVTKGRIVASGARSEVESLANASTRKIEIPGVAVPGFADAHAHLMGVGQQMEQLELRGLTKEQVLTKVADAVRSAPAGRWIVGKGWDQTYFRPPEFPTAADLDVVSGDHPVSLTPVHGHSSWVNSKVLALAGITRRTPDPPGGRIVRNAAGEATGILVDRAQDAVSKVRPSSQPGDRERFARAALQQYARWGLTSIHDPGTDLETIAVYKALLARGELPVRLYVMARGAAATEHYLSAGPELDLGDGLLAIRSFKVSADGALGSRGAELSEPYADAPSEHGLPQASDADLDKLLRAGREKGFQVNVHAIGDRAVHRALDAFERAGVKREERFRIEHASMVTPEDLPRFARLGIIASVQPVFVGEYQSVDRRTCRAGTRRLGASDAGSHREWCGSRVWNRLHLLGLGRPNSDAVLRGDAPGRRRPAGRRLAQRTSALAWSRP